MTVITLTLIGYGIFTLPLYDESSFRASHLGLLYLGSLIVLLAYSILYGLTAKEAHWLGAITSTAVVILGMTIYTNIYARQEFFVGH